MTPPSSLAAWLKRHPDLVALALIALVAALLRLAFLYRAPIFLTGDSQSHFLPGWDLAHGLAFDPELRRPAGYPLFVAGVIAALGEDLRALAFVQHALGVGTALLIYLLGRLTFGRPAGLAAGLLVALDGALILSEHSVMTEALFGTLLLVSLTALTLGALRLRAPCAVGTPTPMKTACVHESRHARRGATEDEWTARWASSQSRAPGPEALRPKAPRLGVWASGPPPVSGPGAHAPRRDHVSRAWPWLLVAGVLLGLVTLVRPVGQILIPLVPLSLLLLTRRWGAVLQGSALVGLGFALLVGPWTLRNWAEHGSLTASGGLGRSLIARTIKYDTGFFDVDRPPAGPGDLKGEVRQFIRGKRNTIRNSRSVRSTQAGLMKELGLTQAQSDGLMRQVALEAIAERPGYYALGSLRMAYQILAGKEKEDALVTRWNQRTDKDWVEQWEARIDHLVTPTTPAEQHELRRAESLVNVYQPAELGPIMPLLGLLGLAWAVAYHPFRPALPAALTVLAIILASAALDGPVPRYRYPVDPLIALFAAGGVIAALQAVATVIPARLKARSGSDHRSGSGLAAHHPDPVCHPERSEGSHAAHQYSTGEHEILRSAQDDRRGGADDRRGGADDDRAMPGAVTGRPYP